MARPKVCKALPHPLLAFWRLSNNFNLVSKLDLIYIFPFGVSGARSSVSGISGAAMKKLSYLFVLCALIVLCARVTQATPVDPKIGLGGGGSCASFSQNTSSQSFTLGAGQLGCIVDFTNNIPGATLTFLTVTVNTPFAGLLSCAIDLTQPNGVSPFSVAQQTAPNACTFSGPPAFPDAVLPGGLYGVQFGYPGLMFQTCDTQGVCTNLTSLKITLTTVPEPASIALIGTGLLALVAGRKRLRKSRLAS
jgi:PEP-CTERM motif